MTILRSLVLILSCSLPMACRSTAPKHTVPCTCGTPEADLVGCAHPKCLTGERNPDNADCVCGPLALR